VQQEKLAVVRARREEERSRRLQALKVIQAQEIQDLRHQAMQRDAELEQRMRELGEQQEISEKCKRGEAEWRVKYGLLHQQARQSDAEWSAQCEALHKQAVQSGAVWQDKYDLLHRQARANDVKHAALLAQLKEKQQLFVQYQGVEAAWKTKYESLYQQSIARAVELERRNKQNLEQHQINERLQDEQARESDAEWGAKCVALQEQAGEQQRELGEQREASERCKRGEAEWKAKYDALMIRFEALHTDALDNEEECRHFKGQVAEERQLSARYKNDAVLSKVSVPETCVLLAIASAVPPLLLCHRRIVTLSFISPPPRVCPLSLPLHARACFTTCSGICASLIL
jgi:hypothetical protein